MGALGKRMDTIGPGIWPEDYPAIAEEAKYTVANPKPPVAQRAKIIGALGSDAAEFRTADKWVYEGALALVEPAEVGQTGGGALSGLMEGLCRLPRAVSQSGRVVLHRGRPGLQSSAGRP